MNIRTRMQERALMQRENIPIMASLETDDGPWRKIVFIHPDDWDEAKRMYGDRLQLVLRICDDRRIENHARRHGEGQGADRH